MRYFISFFLFIFNIILLHAQNETDIIRLIKEGNDFLNRKMYHEAEANYLKALEFDYKENNLAIEAQNGLAVIYRKKGDFQKSDSLFIIALELRKNNYGEESPEYAETLNDYARLCIDRENYSMVETYLLKVLDIRQKQNDTQYLMRNH